MRGARRRARFPRRGSSRTSRAAALPDELDGLFRRQYEFPLVVPAPLEPVPPALESTWEARDLELAPGDAALGLHLDRELETLPVDRQLEPGVGLDSGPARRRRRRDGE